MEFRANIRTLLGTKQGKVDVKEIDALFSRLDSDGSGEMDLNEIKGALKTLQARDSSLLPQEPLDRSSHLAYRPSPTLRLKSRSLHLTNLTRTRLAPLHASHSAALYL